MSWASQEKLKFTCGWAREEKRVVGNTPGQVREKDGPVEEGGVGEGAWGLDFPGSRGPGKTLG